MTKQALIEWAPPEIRDIWHKLDCHGEFCPFCGYSVPAAEFPWRFARHDVHGVQPKYMAAGVVCVGSRNAFTLDLLGMGAIL